MEKQRHDRLAYASGILFLLLTVLIQTNSPRAFALEQSQSLELAQSFEVTQDSETLPEGRICHTPGGESFYYGLLDNLFILKEQCHDEIKKHLTKKYSRGLKYKPSHYSPLSRMSAEEVHESLNAIYGTNSISTADLVAKTDFNSLMFWGTHLINGYSIYSTLSKAARLKKSAAKAKRIKQEIRALNAGLTNRIPKLLKGIENTFVKIPGITSQHSVVYVKELVRKAIARLSTDIKAATVGKGNQYFGKLKNFLLNISSRLPPRGPDALPKTYVENLIKQAEKQVKQIGTAIQRIGNGTKRLRHLNKIINQYRFLKFGGRALGVATILLDIYLFSSPEVDRRWHDCPDVYDEIEESEYNAIILEPERFCPVLERTYLAKHYTTDQLQSDLSQELGLMSSMKKGCPFYDTYRNSIYQDFSCLRSPYAKGLIESFDSSVYFTHQSLSTDSSTAQNSAENHKNSDQKKTKSSSKSWWQWFRWRPSL